MKCCFLFEELNYYYTILYYYYIITRGESRIITLFRQLTEYKYNIL